MAAAQQLAWRPFAAAAAQPSCSQGGTAGGGRLMRPGACGRAGGSRRGSGGSGGGGALTAPGLPRALPLLCQPIAQLALRAASAPIGIRAGQLSACCAVGGGRSASSRGSGGRGSGDSSSRCRRVVVASSAAGAGAVPEPSSSSSSSSGGGSAVLWALAAAAAAAAAVALYVSGHAATLQATLMAGPLGRSGLLASFTLIFLSELGDKTFFIAALLAMRLGRAVAFLGSVAALAVMTLISVAIGAACSRVPESLQSSVPVGELAGVALLVFFGVKALAAAAKSSGADAAGAADAADGGAAASGQDAELADAEEAVAAATSSGRVGSGGGRPLASLFEVASLIFLAEWGDRSMLATIALGAAQNPFGVAVGATAAHAAATALAVAGGALASKHVSERGVNLVSGVLFLLFAAATVYGLVAA